MERRCFGAGRTEKSSSAGHVHATAMALAEALKDILTWVFPAYWIAFGPHGPRALPPPGENTKIFAYTLIGIGAAAVLFGITRSFAREPPRTMSKEWQEATNEYLKVRQLHIWRLARRQFSEGDMHSIWYGLLTPLARIGEECRAHHWFVQRGLQGPGSGSEQVPPPKRLAICPVQESRRNRRYGMPGVRLGCPKYRFLALIVDQAKRVESAVSILRLVACTKTTTTINQFFSSIRQYPKGAGQLVL